jgi:hypothetical protein
VEAVARLDAAVAGKRVVLSDAERWDSMWTWRLLQAAGAKTSPCVSCVQAALLDLVEKGDMSVKEMFERMDEASRMADGVFEHAHRAADDAVEIAAMFRMTFDREYLEQVAVWRAARRRESGGER